MNPNKPETCMLLWLYSIEPPIYAELNKTCNSGKLLNLRTLGPFARALYETLLWV